jgi:hypothetical protein
MATLLPVVKDMHVLDLQSDDGTYEILQDIAKHNPRVYAYRSKFTHVDAKAFADAANECIALATCPNVLFWQADEIWHQDLLLRMRDWFNEGIFDMNFWRVQLRYNWQHIKWYPHPVHRVGPKDNFVFVDDGMNTERRWGVDVCSTYDMGQFMRWEDEYRHDPKTLPLDQMILDVSQVGGFLDNIVDKRKLHSPFWHENDIIEGKNAGKWYTEQRGNYDWTYVTSPFNIPHIMKRHLGRKRYVLDDDILIALKTDRMHRLLGVNL